MTKKLLVSACLLGINSKYNGQTNTNRLLMDYGSSLSLIPICPEQLGGLKTPRVACEIACALSGKDVITNHGMVIGKDGYDYSAEFIRGAEETQRIAKLLGCRDALLKKRSPSCGYGQIYDGSFSGILHDGNGVTAEMLNGDGISIFTEDDISVEFLRRFMND